MTYIVSPLLTWSLVREAHTSGPVQETLREVEFDLIDDLMQANTPTLKRSPTFDRPMRPRSGLFTQDVGGR